MEIAMNNMGQKPKPAFLYLCLTLTLLLFSRGKCADIIIVNCTEPVQPTVQEYKT